MFHLLNEHFTLPLIRSLSVFRLCFSRIFSCLKTTGICKENNTKIKQGAKQIIPHSNTWKIQIFWGFFPPVWEEQRCCGNKFGRVLGNSSKGPGGFGAGLGFGGGTEGRRRSSAPGGEKRESLKQEFRTNRCGEVKSERLISSV